MPRAVETAARVSEVTGVPIEVWDELQELSPLSYPGAPADYCCDEENNYRVTRSVEERLWGIHGTDQNVLLVTHGAFISTFLSSVLRLLPLFVPSKRRRSCCEHYCAGASQS
jgi:broad specificity phosphatase PhoE